MKDIIILGANGFGREVLQWIKDINAVKPTWNIKRLNAQRFDDFFYQHHGAEPEALPRAEQAAPKASPVDTDAAAALAKQHDIQCGDNHRNGIKHE